MARLIGRAQLILCLLRPDKRGGVLVTFSLFLMVALVSVGMGIDYVRAVRIQAKLAALADAAALAAVSKSSMELTPDAARSMALRLFSTQAKVLENHGLVMNYADSKQLSIEVEDTDTATNGRRATIAFRAQSINLFGKILGIERIDLAGEAETATTLAPDTDLYLLIDTSPSMLLPATLFDVNRMVAATNGCAFACHETSNPRSNLRIARSLNINLRTDVVADAVRRLTILAKEVSQNNGATYRIGIHDFDYEYRSIWPTSANADGSWVDGDLDRVSKHVVDAKILPYCRNSERVCGVPDMDTATNYTAALNGLSANVPQPGRGTGRPNDLPRAVVMIITDGMRDEYVDAQGRVLGPMPSQLCETIKARNIRIAVLDTAYLPESASDEWSITNVRNPYLAPANVVGPALRACASPGLYHEVVMGDDLSSSLAQLFQKSIRVAHLVR